MKKVIKNALQILAVIMFIVAMTLLNALPFLYHNKEWDWEWLFWYRDDSDEEPVATRPASVDIPMDFSAGYEPTINFIGSIEIYSDQACTKLLTTGNYESDLKENITVKFDCPLDCDLVSVKIPRYYLGRNTALYSMQLADSGDVILERDGEPCFEVSEININQGAVGRMLVVFEPIGEQNWFPRSGYIYVDGEKQSSWALPIFSGDNQLESFSCSFEIPFGAEFDINETELTFDSVCEIYDGFVVPYGRNDATQMVRELLQIECR